MKLSHTIAITAVAVLVVLGVAAFAFGTPQAPDVTPKDVASGAGMASRPIKQAPAPETQPAEKPEAGQTPPAPDPSAPLAIEIPGCRCHSDDPKVVEEHAAYRMNQCAGCHAGETPTGQ